MRAQRAELERFQAMHQQEIEQRKKQLEEGIFPRRVTIAGEVNRTTGRGDGVHSNSNMCFDIVHSLDLYADMHRFIAVLSMGRGAAIDEVEVRHHPRVAGVSKYGLSRVFKVLADMVAVQMLTRFKDDPVRAFALLGLPFLIGSAGVALAALVGGGTVVVLPTVSVLLALLFTSTLLSGLLGEVILTTAARRKERRPIHREVR